MCKHGRIVDRAVMVEFTEIEGLRNRVKLVIFDIGHKHPRHRHSVTIGVFQYKSEPKSRCSRKRHIEGCVMGNKQSVTDKLEKLGHYLLLSRSILDHIVGDTRNLDNPAGYRHLRIYKGRKGIDHLAVSHQNGADLGDTVVDRTEAGRLEVKHDEFAVE